MAFLAISNHQSTMGHLGSLMRALLICYMFYLYVLLLFILYILTYQPHSNCLLYLLHHLVFLLLLPPKSPSHIILCLLLQHLHPLALVHFIPTLLTRRTLVPKSAKMQSSLFSILILPWLKKYQQRVLSDLHISAGSTIWRKNRNLPI